MSNLLSTSKERVYFKDLGSRFLFVSQGWIEAYTPGRTAAELTGKTDFDVFTKAHASAAFADEAAVNDALREYLNWRQERQIVSSR